jgi:hypothetical protein
MADDENSDLAANAAEQKVTRNRRRFALRISRSRIEKDCGLSAAFILRDSSRRRHSCPKVVRGLGVDLPSARHEKGVILSEPGFA